MKRIFLIGMFIVSHATAGVFTPAEVHRLKHHFFANFHHQGAIVASPSKQNPNYYFDWIRDSAMAMGLVETWYETSQSDYYKKRLIQYVTWTERVQHQIDTLPDQDILGEPKFYIEGTPFAGSWGRPQNDGPALRASVLIRFAQQLLDAHENDYVRLHLYNNTMDTKSMGAIKMDLEYTAHHWQEVNFDLWEEVLGHHFFTAMAQQKALRDGAALARRLKDKHAANFYETQAQLINTRLNEHVDLNFNLIKATLRPHAGPQKNLELDSSIILGVLINPHTTGIFSPGHSLVKNTVHALHAEFNAMFPINANGSGAILFGRYPGDTYDGYQTNSTGNPWFILTATMAEYYYTLANQLVGTTNNQTKIAKYITRGDQYLALIKQYAPTLYISEQINLQTGKQQGARSLTWNYVAILRAIHLREQLESNNVARFRRSRNTGS